MKITKSLVNLVAVVSVLAVLATGCERREYQRYKIQYQRYEEIADMIPDSFDEENYKIAVEEAQKFKEEAGEKVAELEKEIEQRFEHLEETLEKSREAERFSSEIRQRVEDIAEKSKTGIEERDHKGIRDLKKSLETYVPYQLDEDLKVLKEAFPKIVENLDKDAETVIEIAKLEEQTKGKFAYLKGIEETREQLLNGSKRIKKTSKKANRIVRDGLQPFDFKLLHDIETNIESSAKELARWKDDPCLKDMIERYSGLANRLKTRIHGIVLSEIDAHGKKLFGIQNSYARKTNAEELEGDCRKLEHINNSSNIFAPLYFENYEKYLEDLDKLREDVKKHIKICEIWHENNLKANRAFKDGLQAEDVAELDEIKNKLEDSKQYAPNEESASLLAKLKLNIDSRIQSEVNAYRRVCNDAWNLCKREPKPDKASDYIGMLENFYERLEEIHQIFSNLKEYEDSEEVVELRGQIKNRIGTAQKIQELHHLGKKLLAYNQEIDDFLSDGILERKETRRLQKIKNELEDYKRDYEAWGQNPDLEGLVGYNLSLIQGLENRIK